MKDILYTVAYDKGGNLIKATESEKGNDFYCPICKGELTLRKSGKTGKGSKRPHFAHQNLTPNCNPETALHFSFKNLLYKYLEEHITGNIPLQFSWVCKYCNETHTGNLLKKIKSVRLEHDLGICKPDIALLDKENKVFAVVEVVVTHKPEDEVLKHYKDNDIILIQINLKSDKDIDDLENKISKPDFVQFCYNPKCAKCGYYLHKTIMTIIDGECWKCKKIMKVAIVEGGEERESSHAGPDKFTKKEIDFARSKGVIIEEHYSMTVNERYLANTCGHCGTFVGSFYLCEYFVIENDGIFPPDSFHIGYHCDNCYIQENMGGSIK